MRRLLRMLSASLLALTLLVTSLSSATFALAAPGSSTAESPATEHSSAVTGVEKVADPDTSAGWRTFFGINENNPVYSTDKAGRIWVDASVYASNEDAAAAGIAAQMDDPQNDFLISISAIAQTAAIHEQDGTSRDVVFVVSLNSVLGSTTYAGQPQASYVIEALNNRHRPPDGAKRRQQRTRNTRRRDRLLECGHDAHAARRIRTRCFGRIPCVRQLHENGIRHGDARAGADRYEEHEPWEAAPTCNAPSMRQARCL